MVFPSFHHFISPPFHISIFIVIISSFHFTTFSCFLSNLCFTFFSFFCQAYTFDPIWIPDTVYPIALQWKEEIVLRKCIVIDSDIFYRELLLLLISIRFIPFLILSLSFLFFFLIEGTSDVIPAGFMVTMRRIYPYDSASQSAIQFVPQSVTGRQSGSGFYVSIATFAKIYQSLFTLPSFNRHS